MPHPEGGRRGLIPEQHPHVPIQASRDRTAVSEVRPCIQLSQKSSQGRALGDRTALRFHCSARAHCTEHARAGLRSFSRVLFLKNSRGEGPDIWAFGKIAYLPTPRPTRYHDHQLGSAEAACLPTYPPPSPIHKFTDTRDQYAAVHIRTCGYGCMRLCTYVDLPRQLALNCGGGGLEDGSTMRI